MTLLEERPAQPPEESAGTLMEIVPGPRPAGLVKYITSTDHKQIGLNYIVTGLIGFVVAGAMALGMRTQLIVPDNHFVTQNVFNELFTIHGTIMLFVFAGPFAFAGFGNYFVPLMIGAPDMAFPRFNNLSYWLYLGGFTLLLAGFLTNNGAAQFGWFGYAPLTEAIRSPGPGADLWLVGIGLTGFSGIFSAVNIITTIFTLRAPGMVMF
ncbi:MAG TPA: cbb3-type cytochrome c oxidase subunit I, partial [Acidimicrobiales bacterium]|nr:cbb3-type cytochrome c oxidase subunit I [Acidimicrobiales bacterium]